MNEQPPRVPRRRAIHLALAGSFLAAGAGAVAVVGGFLKPRQSADELGAVVSAGHASGYPRGGEPTRPVPTLQFWLSNLDPSDSTPNGSGGGTGLLACWQKCLTSGRRLPGVRSSSSKPFPAGSTVPPTVRRLRRPVCGSTALLRVRWTRCASLWISMGRSPSTQATSRAVAPTTRREPYDTRSCRPNGRGLRPADRSPSAGLRRRLRLRTVRPWGACRSS